MHRALLGCLSSLLVIASGCSSGDAENDRSDDVRPPCEAASLVADIRPGKDSSVPDDLVVLDETLYFRADDGVHGNELWAYDPLAGAALAVDIASGADGSEPDALVGLDGKLYFVAHDVVFGRELRVFDPSDPTAAATPVADINRGSDGIWPDSLVELDGKLYFAADDGVHGVEPWVYDPASGVALVADLRPGSEGSFVNQLTVVDDRLYFTARDGRTKSLWFLDPTLDGATRVDIGADPESPGGDVRHGLVAMDGKLYFPADDDVHGVELWVHDPATGAALVADINPGSEGSSLSPLVVVDGRLYLEADDGAHGRELWAYDPIEGAGLVADIMPGARAGLRHGTPAVLDGKLYFLGYDDVHGEEIWHHDPRTGTTLLVDTVPGRGGTGDEDPEPPSDLTVFDGRLYFTAFDQVSDDRRAQWVYDPASGAEILTEVWPGSGIERLPHRITELNGRRYFGADDRVHGHELWAHDPACPR